MKKTKASHRGQNSLCTAIVREIARITIKAILAGYQKAITPASISNLALARTLGEKRQIDTKSRAQIGRYFLITSITNEQIN